MHKGAMITGHRNVSIDLFRKAEEHLEALLDSPYARADYAVASAATGLVWQASYLGEFDNLTTRQVITTTFTSTSFPWRCEEIFGGGSRDM